MKRQLNKRNLTALIVFFLSLITLSVFFCVGDIEYKNEINGTPKITLGVSDIENTNDCRIEKDGLFVVKGDDPYIIFKTDEPVTITSARAAISDNEIPDIASKIDLAKNKKEGFTEFAKNNRYNTKDGLVFNFLQKEDTSPEKYTYFKLYLTANCRFSGLEIYDSPILTTESFASVSPLRYVAVLVASLLITALCLFLYNLFSLDKKLTLDTVDSLLKKRRRAICSVILLLLTIIIVLWSLRNYTGGSSAKILKFFVVLIISAAAFLIYRLQYIKKCSVETVFLISAVVLGAFSILMFAPCTVPDETSHIASAYNLSNYITFRHSGANGKILVREADLDLYKSIATTKLTRGYYSAIKNHFALFCDNSTLVETTLTPNKNAPFGYIFSGLGITVARLLNLGTVPLVYMGRIFNFAAYTAMSYFAIKKIPVGKIAVYCIALLPMSVQLAVSYSYDSITLAFAMLFVSQIVYMMYKRTPICGKDLTAATVFAILLAPSKLVYTPFILLAILIPRKNFKSAKQAKIFKTVIILSGVFSLFVLQFLISSTSISSASGIVQWAKEPGYTVKWSLANIFATVKIFFRTINYYKIYYFEMMIGDHFGWLNIRAEWVYIALTAALLFASFVSKKGDPEECVRPSGRVWILLISAVSAVLVLASMFFSWTPTSSTMVDGVQGRYFIPLLLPLALVFRGLPFKFRKNSDRHIALVTFFANIMLLANVMEFLPV